MSGVRRSTLTGLVGQGIGPSLTPELHEREAERQGLRYVYKIVDLVIGLRVSEEEEREGLDITSHGETAYHN